MEVECVITVFRDCKQTKSKDLPETLLLGDLYLLTWFLSTSFRELQNNLKIMRIVKFY